MRDFGKWKSANNKMELHHNLTEYRDIDGWINPSDLVTLREYAQKSSSIDGDAIEFGAFHGLSSVILLGSIAKDKKLISVDIIRYSEFQPTIEKYGFGDRSVFFDCGFQNYVFDGSKYSLAFIDHNHSYQDNIDCFNLVLPHVNSGGFILFHDNGEGWPEVEKSVKEIAENCKEVELVNNGYTAVFKKK
jgi:predicted O-methyltransferase YrrM